MSLLLKNYSFIEVIYMLIKFKTKFFMWNTKRDERNNINEQNTNSQRERDILKWLGRVN